MIHRLPAVFILFFFTLSSANAYVGPSAGVTLTGSLIGFITAIVVSLFAILLMPIRLLLARRKKRNEANPDDVNPDKNLAGKGTGER